MATKYWIANNPNAEVTDAQCIALKNLSTADITELEEAISSLDELRAIAGAVPMAAIADVGTANAANNKTAINALLAALRTAGLLTA